MAISHDSCIEPLSKNPLASLTEYKSKLILKLSTLCMFTQKYSMMFSGAYTRISVQRIVFT